VSIVWREMPDQTWHALPLRPGQPLTAVELGADGVQLCDLGTERAAVLMVRPDVWVRVNGQAILGGVRVLEHKDEVLLAETRLYFSTETAPIVSVYRLAEGGRAPICPICRGPIRDGIQAVQCPGCGRWFHQLDAEGDRPAKSCWTYAPTCRFCSHPTAFDAEAAWRPEKEETHV
jgi:hypothetical protein